MKPFRDLSYLLRLISPSKLKEHLHRVEVRTPKLPLTTSGITAAVALAFAWLIHDFRAWKAFGTGGTPATWRGYLRMTKFRLHRLVSFDDPTDTSLLSTDGPSYLKKSIKPRDGPRPKIMSRTMPHRHVPDSIEPVARRRLETLMRKVQAEHPDLLTVSLSKTEGGSTDAIYAIHDLEGLNPAAKHPLINHEIAHVHPADHSLHVWLSDPDATTVIKAGWGQRFPLTFVPSGFIMVYGPRDNAEVDVVEIIVQAGVSWITGVVV